MGELLKPQKMRASQLDAWPVVSSVLFEIAPTSDEIISIVDRTGLPVDWNLSSEERYSHSTRKRAFQPRIHAAYAALSVEDKETVLSLIVTELARRFPPHAKALKTALARVGWILKALSETQQQTGEPFQSMKRNRELQRLLLLQVRDGNEPLGLSEFSEEDQVYNSALLIKDRCVDGQALQDGNGTYVSTAMTQLTSKGHDFLEETDMPTKSSAGAAINPASKKFFVSHSGADRDLAEALVDLLCAALPLKRVDFLCTSVDGSKLQGGDDTDEVLRREICDVPVFMSLLTKQAVTSTYVLFELGARWGCKRHHIPLLAKGAGVDVLREPLKAINALHLGKLADILQLVQDVARILSLHPEPPNSYLSKAHTVEQISLTTVRSANMGGGNPILGAETLAKARLSECVAVLERAADLQPALHNLRELQKHWSTENEQVTVVANDRIVLHAARSFESQPAAGGWKDANGHSLYSAMQTLRRGLTTTQIQGWSNRVTTIAFEHVDKLPCFVVVEVHRQG